ncbi:MAG: hypothetical protein H0W68_03165, partial [Gemmatimonadaceae bacterium]|nr:hypothetical protein [Gemmatimonadaceae bacterium]
FTDDEIERVLGEAARVLRPDGRVVLFWPHARATSVLVLGAAHRLLARSGSRTVLHPPELSLLRSREMAERALVRSGFRLRSYDFGGGDLLIQAVVVGERR